MANEENDDAKRLVIQGRRGSETVYLDGPPSVWGSWRPTPAALCWELDQVESAELYLNQVKLQLPALMGHNVTNVCLVVWPLESARVPSPPPPEAGALASGASALSPSPHSEAIPGPRTEGEESPRSPPEPPGAPRGEEGEEGEEGDLPRREKPGSFVSREGSSARVAPNLFQKQGPLPLTPRSWGTSDFPVVSKRR